MSNEQRVAQLRSELAHLRARYDSGAMSPAIYNAVKALETELSWIECRSPSPNI